MNTAVSHQPRLVLFFTEGVSIRTWHRVGMLAREVGYYSRLGKYLNGIAFVTHGDLRDAWYMRKPGGDMAIKLISNTFRLPLPVYVRLLSTLHARTLRSADLFKCNQVQGGHIALALAKKFRKPFIARCGYLHSDFVGRQKGFDSPEAFQAREMERALFRGADHCIVTTSKMLETLVSDYGVDESRVSIIGNFVETDIFHPASSSQQVIERLVFLGRLTEQKNLAELIRATVAEQIGLTIIGEGEERQGLEYLTAQLGADVKFLGNRPHRDLPDLLRQHMAFVLPSLYEGHPKALLEAMSCGLPVIGSDVPGIRDSIRHGETGLLAPPTAEGLAAAIRHLRNDASMRAKLGAAGQAYIQSTLSVDSAITKELSIINRLIYKARNRAQTPR